jgi:hypothetical protein
MMMNKDLYSLLFKVSIGCLIFAVGCLRAYGQRYEDFSVTTPLAEEHTLIIGFLGGRESWDNQTQGVRKMALKLRALNLTHLHVETVENNKRHLAVELIRRAFDRDRNGRLDEQECASVRLILYGQSFGGAAVVKLARQLEQMKVPVLLTVQVDSIGLRDKRIPANVFQAANLFQRNGWVIKGEPRIVPQDTGRTTIIGNFEFDYRDRKIDISAVAWQKKIFRAAHTRMDHDPAVWNLVERLMIEAISRGR